MKEVKYWDKKDSEWLHYKTKDEAIRSILGGIIGELPETITIYGYAPMVVDWSWMEKHNG